MNNKKGVKLLATVMVFALAFAGAAFICSSDEADATAITLVPTTAVTGDLTLDDDNEKAYTDILVNGVGKTIKLTFDVDMTNAVSVYVVDGTTVEVVFKTAQTNTITLNTVKTDFVDSPDDTYVVANSSVDIAGAGADANNTFVYNAKLNADGTTLETTVSGTVSSTGVTNTGSEVAVDGNGLTVKGATYSTTNSIKAGIISYVKTGNITTYYADGTDVGSIELSENDVSYIFNGYAVVSQGDNYVEVLNKDTTLAKSIKVSGKASNAIPGIEGTISSDGNLTITNGSFIKTGSGITIVAGKMNMVAIDTSDAYSSQIPSAVPAGVTINTDFTIYGNVTQTTSNSAATTFALVLDTNANYVINEGVTLLVDSVAGTSATTDIVRVFGKLTNGGSVTTASVKVGPNGYASGTVAGTTNVTSGNDSVIGGNIQSETLGTTNVATNGLTIPEGKTVTLNGNLGMNGQPITVNGTLVISKGSSIFGKGNETITLGANGKIVNEGTIGKFYLVTFSDETHTVGIKGVSGAQFSVKKVDSNNVLALSGDIKALKNLPTGVTSSVAVSDAVLSGELTIGKDVTMDISASGSDVKILKNSIVTINGELTGGASSAVVVGEKATLTVNGKLKLNAFGSSFTIKVTTGHYDDEDNSIPTPGSAHLAITNSYTSDGANGTSAATGFTIYSDRIAVLGDDGEYDYFLRAFINGTLDKFEEAVVNTPVATLTNDKLYVAADEVLVIKKDAKFLTSDMDVVILGSVEYANYSDGSRYIQNYIGAVYTITPQGANATSTAYYTTVDVAIAAIDTADEKTVTIKIGTLDQNITVADGQSVTITATTVAEDAVFTAEAGSDVNVTIDTVRGMVTISGDATSTTNIRNAASQKVGTDGTKTYAGFSVAVKNAVAGDVITIGTDTVGTSPTQRKNLTVPADVKIVVTGILTIYGNLTIPEGAELVGGNIKVIGDANSPAEVKVDGKLDLSAGVLGGSNNTVTSNGEIIVTAVGSNMNGAYYKNSDGKYVLTGVVNAIAKSTSTVNITGTYTDMTAITLDGVNLTINDKAKVTLGNITLASGKIIATGDLSATVTAKCGSDATTGAVSDATLKLVKSSVTMESKKVTSAAGVTTYSFVINGLDGEMTVTAGTVTLDSSITSLPAGTKVLVAEGAGLDVISNVTIEGGEASFVVDGKLTAEATVTFKAFTNAVPTIKGTLEITEDGTIDAYALSVLGAVVIDKTETGNGVLNIKGNGVTVGAPMESLGAAASISGIVNITDAKYFLAFAGADLSAAQIDVTAGVSAAVSTEFFVNGVSYATAYAKGTAPIYTLSGGSDINGNDVITKTMLNEIEGVDAITSNYFLWKDAEGNELNSTSLKVGDEEAVYYDMTVASANVTISIGTGMSLWIDGLKQNNTGNGAPAQIKVGQHDIKVIVDPGYKGTTTITFNGKTITDGKLVITSDMVGQDINNVLTAVGDITIDAGEQPAPAEKDDSGMGITDYLLIVLVILAAILVVVVAIRMMRS